VSSGTISPLMDAIYSYENKRILNLKSPKKLFNSYNSMNAYNIYSSSKSEQLKKIGLVRKEIILVIVLDVIMLLKTKSLVLNFNFLF
jgi:hypothetical protein